MKELLRSLMPVALAATIAVGCQTVQTTGGGAVGVDRGQMMMVSAEEVEQASSKQYHELIAAARGTSLACGAKKHDWGEYRDSGPPPRTRSERR